MSDDNPPSAALEENVSILNSIQERIKKLEGTVETHEITIIQLQEIILDAKYGKPTKKIFCKHHNVYPQ